MHIRTQLQRYYHIYRRLKYQFIYVKHVTPSNNNLAALTGAEGLDAAICILK